jgi:methylated-DNA-[protein]-cysteine S-methyltransferase
MPFVIEWIESCSGAVDVFTLATPAGALAVCTQDGVITQLDWCLEAGPASSHCLQQQLIGHWQNPHTVIEIKLLKQGSAYRHQVWAQLCKIPLGETLTYAAVASRIGSAARAVGNACRDNPYPLFIPCHRVVSASGLGGYCGQTEGDLMAIKLRLLAFEASYKA